MRLKKHKKNNSPIKPYQYFKRLKNVISQQQQFLTNILPISSTMKKLVLLLAFAGFCYIAQPVVAQEANGNQKETVKETKKDKKDKGAKKTEVAPEQAKGVVREKGVKNPAKTDFTPEQMTELRLKELDKIVGLTDEQKVKARELSLKFYNDLAALKPMKETDKNGFLAKNTELGRKAVTDVRAILNTDQQKKFDDFEKNRKQRKKK